MPLQAIPVKLRKLLALIHKTINFLSTSNISLKLMLFNLRQLDKTMLIYVTQFVTFNVERNFISPKLSGRIKISV
jgi:hypothetical protein